MQIQLLHHDVRQFAGRLYFHRLVATALAGRQPYLAARDAEAAGEKCDQFRISAAVDWRRAQAHLETISVHAVQLGTRRARRYAQAAHQQIGAAPVAGGR